MTIRKRYTQGIRYVRLIKASILELRIPLLIMFPTTCKYHPSCSEYTIEAIERHGIIGGSLRGALRILRCTFGVKPTIDIVKS